MAARRTLQVGVKAVIEDAQGRILMLRRSEPFLGQNIPRWDIPGGRIKVAETMPEALAREIREETTMRLEEIGDVFYVQDIMHNPKLHVVRITFLAKAKGSIKLSDAHSDYKWFAREDIPLGQADPFLVEAMQANDWIEAE